MNLPFSTIVQAQEVETALYSPLDTSLFIEGEEQTTTNLFVPFGLKLLGWAALSTDSNYDMLGVWASTANNAFAGGENGSIVRYNGVDWNTMTSSTSREVTSLWGTASNDVFATANDLGVDKGLIMHYNGSSAWQWMTLGEEPPLYGLWGTASNDVFAVGDAGAIYHYDGNDWGPMTNTNTALLNGVWGTASDNVYAVGETGAIVHYDGVEWQTMSSGTSLTLNAIWGSAPDDIFVVGNSGLILHYNGLAWAGMTSGTTQNLNGVWSTGPDEVFAVGDTSTILYYNGDTWYSMNNGYDNNLYAISGTAGDSVFAVGIANNASPFESILQYTGSLEGSVLFHKAVYPTLDVVYQGLVTYSIQITNSTGQDLSGLSLDDVLPTEVDFVQWVQQPSGATVNNDILAWSGDLSVDQNLTFQFQAMHVGSYGDVVVNDASLDQTDFSAPLQASATFSVVTNLPPTAWDDTFYTWEDVSVSGNLTASDPYSDALTFSIITLPSGDLALSEIDGSFTYTPTANTNGSDWFTFKASDSITTSNLATVTIIITSVNDAPVFTSSPVVTATENQPYTYAVTTTDIESDTITITDLTLPTWLTLTDNGDGTATLSGTPAPADVGSHSVELVASDSTDTATQTFTILVIGVTINNHPTFISTPPLTATTDITYVYSIETQDVNGDVLTITAPIQPAWLVFNDNGDGSAFLGGIPQTDDIGSHDVQLTVDDGTGIATQTFTIVVTGFINTPPEFTSTPSLTAFVEQTYTYDIMTTDVDSDTLSITAPTIPAWLSLSDNGDGTATLSGVPQVSDAGSHMIELVVSDGSDTATQTFSVTVTTVSGNFPPEFTSTPVTTATVGQQYSYTALTTDIEGDPLNISIKTQPAWLGFTNHGDGTATLSGTPSTSHVGLHTVELMVSDGTDTATQTFTISVTEEIIVIGTPLLSINKSVNAAGGTANLPLAGVVTYTINLVNSGDGTALGVALTDTLPVSLTFGSWLTQDSAQETNNTITWSGDLAASEQLTLQFTAILGNGSALYSQTITNMVQYTASNAVGGSDSVSFTVTEEPVTTVEYFVFIPLLLK